MGKSKKQKTKEESIKECNEDTDEANMPKVKVKDRLKTQLVADKSTQMELIDGTIVRKKRKRHKHSSDDMSVIDSTADIKTSSQETINVLDCSHTKKKKKKKMCKDKSQMMEISESTSTQTINNEISVMKGKKENKRHLKNEHVDVETDMTDGAIVRKKKKRRKHLSDHMSMTDSTVNIETLSCQETVNTLESGHAKKRKKKKLHRDKSQIVEISELSRMQNKDSYADTELVSDNSNLQHRKKRKKHLDKGDTGDESSHINTNWKITTDISSCSSETALTKSDLLKATHVSKIECSIDTEHHNAMKDSNDLVSCKKSCKKNKKRLLADNLGNVGVNAVNKDNKKYRKKRKEQLMLKSNDSEEILEYSSAPVQRPKHKKTHHDFEQPASCTENPLLVDCVVEKTEAEAESANKHDVNLGQWGTVNLGSEDRRAKFLRLLGAGRAADGSKNSHSHANTALSRDGEVQLNRALEHQYETAMSTALGHRGGGLGYVPPPTKSNKFRIDCTRSTSIKFED